MKQWRFPLVLRPNYLRSIQCGTLVMLRSAVRAYRRSSKQMCQEATDMDNGALDSLRIRRHQKELVQNYFQTRRFSPHYSRRYQRITRKVPTGLEIRVS